MVRIRHNYNSWEKGKVCMNLLSQELNSPVIERGEYLRIETDTITASCHLDFSNEAFILIKFDDESIKAQIEKIIKQAEN